ncbi:flagellar basal body rod protein FlgB, partial [Candidatus Darwinibacter acetoxidans]
MSAGLPICVAKTKKQGKIVTSISKGFWRGGALVFKLVDRLSVGLSKASLRQTVLSNNLANFNTPGFKRSDV